MTHKSISGLPYEVLDHIVDYIDSHRDVLTISLLSSKLHAIAVPHHLEYRRITISFQDVYLWKHLAQRPDLAANHSGWPIKSIPKRCWMQWRE
ncbi:hypothetical protein BV25DRAFT_303008 [Artomyces pyxidatus]|uniref:Uncharacterized protein n=1 Tax=Artomyces pyxidatus TaxID=48021 RepID=A0ACB8T6A3_9AGAM|nr:hypothetical protein BV25DRAFT_303008 [Artomyces pyxidatus]